MILITFKNTSKTIMLSETSFKKLLWFNNGFNTEYEMFYIGY